MNIRSQLCLLASVCALLFLLAPPALTPAAAAGRRQVKKAPPAKTDAQPSAGEQAKAEHSQQPVAPESPPRPAPRIPLNTHLRFYIRPTLLGLVPPADPLGYGSLFFRVLAVGDGQLKARYEAKEELEPGASPASAGDDASAAGMSLLGLTPDERRARQTRIRRGQLSASGLASARGYASPLFFGDGDWESAGSLLWLSHAAFDELAASGRTNFDPLPESHAEDAGADELKRHVQMLCLAAGIEFSANAELIAESNSSAYPCYVNGVRANLPALRAHDSLGLADYWILNDPDNPLILKVTFIAPAQGEALSAAEQQPAADAAAPAVSSPATREPGKQPAGDQGTSEVQSSGSAAETPPSRFDLWQEIEHGSGSSAQDSAPKHADAKPRVKQPTGDHGKQPAADAPSLVAAGGGYAITEIDF